MNNLKRLILLAAAASAMAALAVPAFASAEATECKVSTVPCPEGSRYATGEVVDFTSADFRIIMTPTVFCDHVTINLHWTGWWTFHKKVVLTDCHTDNSACNVAALGSPYKGEFDVTGSGPNGTATTSGEEYFVNCAGFINCTFGSASLSLPITGGASASMTASNVALSKISGFLCPSSPKMSGTFKASNLWIRPGP